MVHDRPRVANLLWLHDQRPCAGHVPLSSACRHPRCEAATWTRVASVRSRCILVSCHAQALVTSSRQSSTWCNAAGEFGLFEGDASTVFFEVQTVLSNHVAAVLPAVVIGLACGALGIIFTVMNLKVTRLRELYIGVRFAGCVQPSWLT